MSKSTPVSSQARHGLKVQAPFGDIEALVVKPRIAWVLLQCSNTRGYELIANGELDSFKDGRSRKITVDSIRAYIARRLALPDVTQDAAVP
jgi:hypothetical protein